MSYLQKIQAQNRKQWNKVTEFLKNKSYDINNLPKIQTKRPIIQQRIQTSMISNHEQTDTDDSNGFDIIAYLNAKKKKECQQSIKQTPYITTPHEQIIHPAYNQNKIKQQVNDFNIQQFQYSQTEQRGTSLQQYRQQFKSKSVKVNVKEKKIINNYYLKQIDPKIASALCKIQDVLKNNEPLRINYIRADNKWWENYKKQEDYRLDYVLSKFPKIKTFKNNQKAIIKCGLQNNNIFVCMPTGGGKSLTFQTLTFLIKGVYLCVLPLISLIFDQEYQAKILGIQAYSLTANTQPPDIKYIYNKLQHFQTNQKSIVIFCTPEKLNLSQNFSQLIDLLYRKQQLKRIIIDEVHCVSTWGKQFRKEYENLSSIKKRFPKTPILALTATVTEVVKQDIITRLGIQNCYFFQSSFNRPNLYYQVKQKDKNIFLQIQQIIKKHRNKTGIIYCLSRRQCEQTSQKLNKFGYKTAFYHAQIHEEEKKQIQQGWMKNTIHIIVATVAFGMGINKPDVRFVIHHTMSKSLQNYYQQSGRAGRDGQYSECILFYKKGDKQSLLSMTMKNDFSTMANKQFSTKQLAQMIKYCEDKITCRRQFQLHYLGQTDFNPESCNKTCDNCRKSNTYAEFQCIEQGKFIIKALLKAEQSKISLSKNQLIAIMRNKADKSTKYKLSHLQRAGINLNQLYQTFQKWKIDQIQLLLLQFFSNDILTQKIVQNQVYRNQKQNVVMNLYLKCNVPRCKIFMQKVESLPIKRQIKSNQSRREREDENGEDIFSQETESCQQDNSNIDYKRENGGLSDSQQQQKYEKYKDLLSAIFEQDD